MIPATTSSGITLKDILERRPEVTQADISLQHIETTFHPEFCAQLCGSMEKTQPDIRLRGILPLLKGGGLTFLTHEEADTSVLAENLWKLTTAGQREYDAVLSARVAEIVPTGEGLSTYAAQRLAVFEQHRLGDTYRQPETRHEWIPDILRGMAEVCGQDAAPLLQFIERRLTDAHGASAVEMLSQAGQKHAVQALRRYASALEQLGGGQRRRLMRVRDLLQDMAAYLP